MDDLRGSKPNVFWRAVTTDELNLHPLYHSLDSDVIKTRDPSLTIKGQVQGSGPRAADESNEKDENPSSSSHAPPFPDLATTGGLGPITIHRSHLRQHTQEWNEAHVGRLSSASVSACLGVWERYSIKHLAISKSYQDHDRVVNTWKNLIQAVIWDREKWNGHWCWVKRIHDDDHHSHECPSPEFIFDHDHDHHAQSFKTKPWIENSDPNTRDIFPFIHMPSHEIHPANGSAFTIHQTRLRFGITQEPSALLCALHHFHIQGVTLHEAEMFSLDLGKIKDGENHHTSAEWDGTCKAKIENERKLSISSFYIDLASKFPNLPPIASSPDALLHWPDGTVEPLEVKCRCPFVLANERRSSKRKKKTEQLYVKIFGLSDPGPETVIKPHHIFQIYLHMLCVGLHYEQCTSAVWMSFSVSRGCNFFRVKRDDAFLQEMLFWIDLFSQRFVKNSCKCPPQDFFAQDRFLNKRYAQFMKRAKKLSQQAQVIAELNDDQVFKSQHNTNFFL